MDLGTYGLSQALPTKPRVSGPSIATLGSQDQQQAMTLIGSAAGQATQRGMANDRQAQEAKAGNQQLGATAGAAIGTIWGPAGTMVGGMIGGALGGLF